MMAQPHSQRFSVGSFVQTLGLWLAEGATYALLLLMPLFFFEPLSQPPIFGILPLYITPGVYLSDGALLVILLVAFLMRAIKEKGPLELSTILLGLALLAFLTAPWAMIPDVAFYKACRGLIAFAVYLWFAQKVLPLERLLWLFALGLALQALIALAQVNDWLPVGWVELFAPRKSGRAFGLTFNPNVLGGYMAVGVLLTMPLLKKPLAWLLWWLLWIGLFVSFSRAAWLGTWLMVPVVATWMILRLPTQRKRLAIAFIGAGIVWLTCCMIWFPQFSGRLKPVRAFWQNAMVTTATPTATLTVIPSKTAVTVQPTATEAGGAPTPSSQEVAVAITPTVAAPAIQSQARASTFIASLYESFRKAQKGRLDMIEMAVGVVAQRPWTGIGASNFPILMLHNPQKGLGPMFVHHVPLLLTAELGILGGGLWLAAWLLIVLAFKRHLQGTNRWAMAACGAWLALAVIGLFDSYPWALNSGLLLTMMVSGVVARTWEVHEC